MTNPNGPHPPPLFHPPSSPSFSSVPDEIVVCCLARISKSHYRSLCSVSKNFHSLLSSPEIYAARSQIGATEPRLYVCLWFPTDIHRRWFTLSNPEQTTITNGGEIKGELSLLPVKLFSSCSPAHLNSTTVAVGSEIYQIGGGNNDERSRAVRVFDCRSNAWRCGPKMLVARKRAKSWFLDGKIYVMGGCRKRDKSMNWGEVLDIKTQTWKPLPSPSDDLNHKIVIFGGKLCLLTKSETYAYNSKEGRWLLEVGFVGLERITGSWCLIENVMFTEFDGKYMWYDSRLGEWLIVKGLAGLYRKRGRVHRTRQLVNYGGKLVIIWHELIDAALTVGIRHRGPARTLDKRIWCAVIRLEERLDDSGRQIWGVIERSNAVFRVPQSYKFLACLSVSV